MVKKGDKFSQKLIKFDVKKHPKTSILNGKIEFFIKINTIDTKMSEKVTKIDQHLEYKNRSHFDYQKGG